MIGKNGCQMTDLEIANKEIGRLRMGIKRLHLNCQVDPNLKQLIPFLDIVLAGDTDDQGRPTKRNNND